MKIIDIIFFVMIIIVFYNVIKYKIIDDYKYNKLCKNSDEDYDLNLFNFDNNKSLKNSTLPKIFIHYQPERNERNWEDFGSRSSYDYNLELSNICIKSFIKCYSSYCDIIIFNNDNVKELINDESDIICNIINPSLLKGIDLEQWERYCRAKILYLYGGIVLKPVFYCLNSNNNLLFRDEFTVANINNNGVNVSNKLFVANPDYLMSSPAKDRKLLRYCNYLKKLCINNYSVDKHFSNDEYEFLSTLPTYNEVHLGLIDINYDQIHMEDLISNRPLKVHKSAFCLFIDIDNLKKYTKYGWILKMNKNQILDSNIAISHIFKQHCL